MVELLLLSPRDVVDLDRDHASQARITSLPERFQLGLALGELGDPRIAQDLRDPAAYVEIPAGKYPLGDDKKPCELK